MITQPHTNATHKTMTQQHTIAKVKPIVASSISNKYASHATPIYTTIPLRLPTTQHMTSLPSPHDAVRCVSNCEPALRTFIRRSTNVRPVVTAARAALNRLQATNGSRDGSATKEEVARVSAMIAQHLEVLETEVETMRTEVSALRDTTVREVFKHCAPAHHPLVRGLHHLSVRPLAPSGHGP